MRVMFVSRHPHEIFKSVVVLYPIQMVNYPTIWKWAISGLPHNFVFNPTYNLLLLLVPYLCNDVTRTRGKFRFVVAFCTFNSSISFLSKITRSALTSSC